jgi:hypothetical protein
VEENTAKPTPRYLRKVISGAQIGADMAGLLGAKAVGIETGGHCPKGFKTERGSKPELAKLGVKETKTSGYPERTELNVINSDATLLATMIHDSAGSKLTQALCDKHKKPVIGVGFFTGNPPDVDTTAHRLADYLHEQKIEVLNVAGNRESKAPGLQTWLCQVLIKAFTLLGERSNV